MSRCASVFLDPRDTPDGYDVRRSALDVTGKKVHLSVELWEPWSSAAFQIACTHNCWDSARDNFWVHFGDGSGLKEARIIYWQNKLKVQLVDFTDPPKTKQEANDPNYYPLYPAYRPDKSTVEFSLPLSAVRARGADRFYWNVETHETDALVRDGAPDPGKGENAYGQDAYVQMLTSKRQAMRIIGRDARFPGSPPGSEPPLWDLHTLSIGRNESQLQVTAKVRQELSPNASPTVGGISWTFDVGARHFRLEFSRDATAADSYNLYEVKKRGVSDPVAVEGGIESREDGFSVAYRIELSRVTSSNWRGTVISGSGSTESGDVTSQVTRPDDTPQQLDVMATSQDFVLC